MGQVELDSLGQAGARRLEEKCLWGHLRCVARRRASIGASGPAPSTISPIDLPSLDHRPRRLLPATQQRCPMTPSNAAATRPPGQARLAPRPYAVDRLCSPRWPSGGGRRPAQRDAAGYEVQIRGRKQATSKTSKVSQRSRLTWCNVGHLTSGAADMVELVQEESVSRIDAGEDESSCRLDPRRW